MSFVDIPSRVALIEFKPRPLIVLNCSPAALKRKPGNVFSRSSTLLPTIGRFSIFSIVKTSPTDADDSRNTDSRSTETSTDVVTAPTSSVKFRRTCPAYGKATSLCTDSLEAWQFGGNLVGSRLENGKAVRSRFIGDLVLRDACAGVLRGDPHPGDQCLAGIQHDPAQLCAAALRKRTSSQPGEHQCDEYPDTTDVLS